MQAPYYKCFVLFHLFFKEYFARNLLPGRHLDMGFVGWSHNLYLGVKCDEGEPAGKEQGACH